MMSLNCERLDLNDLLPQYLAGRLDSLQLEEVEAHLLDCAVCWEEVHLGTALRKARWSARRRSAVTWVSGLAAASALIWFLIWPAANPYRELGRVDSAPRSRPATVRSDSREPVAIIDSGMAAYGLGDYRTAERLLTRGTAETPQPGAWFFLGVSRLLLNRPAEAVAALSRALLPEDNAFEAEARVYLAKAFLRLGRPDSALAHLRIAESSHATSTEAAALRRAVEQVDRSR